MSVLRPHWKIEHVPPILRALEPIADRHGFLVSAYGSTMRYGSGRDLDLIFVQKRINVVPRYCLDAVIHELRGKLVGEPDPSLFCELCALVELGDDRIIDMQFRLSKCAPSDALDLYGRPRKLTEQEERAGIR